MYSLAHAVSKLALSRAVLAEAKAHKKALIDAFMASPEMVNADKELNDAALAEHEAKQAVDDAALAEYRASGDKHPHNAVSIAITKRYTYDDEEVTAWAIAHEMPALLSPVAKAVKALAKTESTDIPVTMTDEPGTRIKTDLSAWLY